MQRCVQSKDTGKPYPIPLMEVVSLNQRRLYQVAKSLIFRRKMSEKVEILEDEIRSFLLKERKEEITSGGLRISIKREGQLEVQEVPLPSFDQMELPFHSSPVDQKRKENRKLQNMIEELEDRWSRDHNEGGETCPQECTARRFARI